MTIARNHHIFKDEPTYYHLMSRCVRRAFLCGKDKQTGKRYDHRKRWLEKRVFELSEIFFIDLYGYAIMSNHYHLVVKTRPDSMRAISDIEIATRWCRLYPQRDAAVKDRVKQICTNKNKISCYRDRLADISWLMSCLNEGLARLSNKEDSCTGRFWQGRFKSQILLDEAAVYTCMAYVDLNPFRAGIAKTPESSKFTSIVYRINEHNLEKLIKPINDSDEVLSMKLSSYLTLVDETGRQIRDGKSGFILNKAKPILLRLRISEKGYMKIVRNMGQMFCRGIGSVDHLEELSISLNQSWVKGRSEARNVFG